MATFFDALCSSWLIAVPILIVIFLVICFTIFRIRFQNERLNSFFTIIFILVIPAIIFTFSYYAGSVYGFGYATNFKANLNNEKWLCFITEGTFKMHNRGRRSSDINCRINVINPKTGERIYRKVLGDYSEAIKLKGDTLLYKEGGSSFVLYDINKGAEIAHVSHWNLQDSFNEFSSGVDEIKYGKYSGTLEATAKNGKMYYIDPFLMKLYTENPKLDKAHYSNDDVRAETFDLKISKDNTVELNRKHDGVLFELVDENKKIIIADDLIEARIIGHSWELKRYLIESYETTEKDNFIISCFSYEGKLLWQLKQTALDANDFFTKDNTSGSSRYAGYTSTMDTHQVVAENFVFTIQGFVFSVDINSGKLNWKTRL